ncbi:MAG: hypothetical protein HY517_04045 [Candidatus Aenigmarchaeota archaeon]|nr:hypothetical protein [Candidatus Aenigmarchaeota archaeon]
MNGKILIFASVAATLLISACVSQQEIKLSTDCSSQSVNEQCIAACQSNFTAELDAWRCSAAGQPVCLCKAYKEPDQFIG